MPDGCAPQQEADEGIAAGTHICPRDSFRRYAECRQSGKNNGGKKRRQCKRNRYGTLMRSDKNRGHGRLAGRFAPEGVTARGTTLGAYRQYCRQSGQRMPSVVPQFMQYVLSASTYFPQFGQRFFSIEYQSARASVPGSGVPLPL